MRLARRWRSAGPTKLARSRSRGVALIIALMVVALAMATLMPQASRERLTVASTANLLDTLQAHALAGGVLAWAEVVLSEDADADAVDYLGERWATPVPALAVERGTVGGRLHDLRGRLNLNALVDARGVNNAIQFARLERLLTHLSIPVGVAGAILDWVDADDLESIPSGAESAHYLALTPAYRASNHLLTSVSELRLIAGIDEKTYAVLRSHVSALDWDMNINLNTASLAVLSSLGERLDTVALTSFIQKRVESPLRGLADVRAETAFSGVLDDLQGLSVVSDRFALEATVRLPRAKLRFHCVISRGPNETRAQRCWTPTL